MAATFMTAKSEYRDGSVDVARSGWTAFPAERTKYPTLSAAVDGDVAVVGGGLAGASVALELARRGVKVVLVEAREIGWGASGRNAGHVAAHREFMPSLRRLPDRGEGFLDLWRREVNLLYDLVKEFDINCDAVQGGYLKVALSDAQLREAEQHVRTYSDIGLKVSFADRKRVAAFTGTNRFYGGALDESGGRVNPYYFTRGLARAIEEKGGLVFEQTPATALKRVDNKWHVWTPDGRVRVRSVVLCTGAYDESVCKRVTKSWLPCIAYAIATKPLPREIRDTMLPTGGVCAQLPQGFMPFLVDGMGRLVSALLPGRRAEDWRPALNRLQRWYDRTYAHLGSLRLQLDSYWTGRLAVSSDELPRIYRLGPDLLALNCFSTEGNLPAPIVGKHLAEKIVEDRLEELVFPLSEPDTHLWRGHYDFLLRHVVVPVGLIAERLRLVG